MSTINIDVMKQLLIEFVEKEAFATEEITVVKQQIDELEKRIQGCKEMLRLVSEDKEKIATMKIRYGGGGVLLTPSAKSTLSNLPPANLVSPVSPVSPAALSSSLNTESVTEPTHALPNLSHVLGQAEISQQEGSPAAEESPAPKVAPSKLFESILPQVENAEAAKEASADSKTVEPVEAKASGESSPPTEEGGDDTVKSINDALRGLFR